MTCQIKIARQPDPGEQLVDPVDRVIVGDAREDIWDRRIGLCSNLMTWRIWSGGFAI
jgi:hypothetical protein